MTNLSCHKRRLLLSCGAGAGIAILFLFIALLGPSAKWFVKPGPLTSAHAPAGRDCANCHAGEKGEIKGLLHGLKSSAIALNESKRCLKCHILGVASLQPHAKLPSELELLTEKYSGHRDPNTPFTLSVAVIMGGPPQSSSGEISCAVCHKEHQGTDFDLTKFSDMQCQICHKAPVYSFSDGHRMFENYPYKRRTRIIFDHAQHEAKHFPKLKEKFSCTNCHRLAENNRFMEALPFKSCSACHTNELRGEGRAETGVPFLRLPGLDLMVITEAKLSIGSWPADADEGFDASSTVFMDLLIAGDERYPEFEADRKLIEGLELSDLGDISREDLQAVIRYVRGIKRLVFDLANDASATFANRLSLPGEEEIVQNISAILSQNAFRSTAVRWFPNLFEELTLSDGESLKKQKEKNGQQKIWAAAGGWQLDDSDLSLRYLPADHENKFFKGWFKLVEKLGEKEKQAVRVFDYLYKDDGRCTKCHSVDWSTSKRGDAHVNFSAAMPEKAQRFIEFSHKPHLPLVSKEKGCGACHIIDEESDYLAGYKNNGDPRTFAAEFKVMTKTQCLECHRPELTRQSCITCHSYHVGEIKLKTRAENIK